MPRKTPWSHTFLRLLAGTAAFLGLAGARNPRSKEAEAGKITMPNQGLPGENLGAVLDFLAQKYPDMDQGVLDRFAADSRRPRAFNQEVQKAVNYGATYSVAGLVDDYFAALDLSKPFAMLGKTEKYKVVILWEALQHQMKGPESDIGLTDRNQKDMKMFMDISLAWDAELRAYMQTPEVAAHLPTLPSAIFIADHTYTEETNFEKTTVSTDEMYELARRNLASGKSMFPISDMAEDGHIVGVSAIDIFHADPAATQHTLEKLPKFPMHKESNMVDSDAVLHKPLTKAFSIPREQRGENTHKENLLTAFGAVCDILSKQPERFFDHGTANMEYVFKHGSVEFSVLYKFTKRVGVAYTSGENIDPDVQAFGGLVKHLFFGDTGMLEALPAGALEGFIKKYPKNLSGKFFDLFAESFAKSERSDHHLTIFTHSKHDTRTLRDLRQAEATGEKLAKARSPKEIADLIIQIQTPKVDVVAYARELAVSQGFMETKLEQGELSEEDKGNLTLMLNGTKRLISTIFSKVENEKFFLTWLHDYDKAYHVGRRFGEPNNLRQTLEQGYFTSQTIMGGAFTLVIAAAGRVLGNLAGFKLWGGKEEAAEPVPPQRRRRERRERGSWRDTPAVGSATSTAQPVQSTGNDDDAESTTSSGSSDEQTEDQPAPTVSHYTKAKSEAKLLEEANNRRHTGAAVKKIVGELTSRVSADDRFAKFIEAIQEKEKREFEKRRAETEAKLEKLTAPGVAPSKGKAPAQNPALQPCLDAIKAIIDDLVKEGQSDATLKLSIFKLYEKINELNAIDQNISYKHIKLNGLRLLRHIIAHHNHIDHATNVVDHIKQFATKLKQANIHETGFSNTYRGESIEVLRPAIYTQYFKLNEQWQEERKIAWKLEQFAQLSSLFDTVENSKDDELCFNIYMIGEFLGTANDKICEDRAYIKGLINPIKDARRHIAHEKSPYPKEKLEDLRNKIIATKETWDLSVAALQREKNAAAAVPHSSQITFMHNARENGGSSSGSGAKKEFHNGKGPRKS